MLYLNSMKLPKLYKVKVLKKYKMFFIDALMEDTGEIITAYTRNKGGFKKEMAPGSTVYISFDGSPHRKTKYSVELIEQNGLLSGVDPQLANKLIKEFLEKPNDLNLTLIKNEVTVNKSRLDLSLKFKDQVGFGEVKTVLTYKEDLALFPEAPTPRGQKHLQELINLAQQKVPAFLFYVVQVPHAQKLKIRGDIDIEYLKLMKKSQKVGVKIYALKCNISKSEIFIDYQIPIEL
jgi:sugar fermentation stimulation protein A